MNKWQVAIEKVQNDIWEKKTYAQLKTPHAKRILEAFFVHKIEK